MDNVFGNLFGSLGGLAPKDPYQDLLKDYYDPKAAKWSMVGSALSGLGTGLMTRDWAKAAEVSGQGMSSYRDNAMKRYAAAEMMSAAEEKKKDRARRNQLTTKWGEFVTNNRDKFGQYGEIAPYLDPGEGMQILSGMTPDWRPASPEEKAQYGVDPTAPLVIGKGGEPKILGGNAPTTNNYVSVGGETPDSELRKNLDKGEADSWTKYKEAGNVSAVNNKDFAVLDKLIQVAPQGPLVGDLAKRFPGFTSSGAAFQSIIKRIAPTLRVAGSGSTSDIEYQGMLESLPSLSNKPEANALILEMMKAKNQINIERAKIITQYQRREIDVDTARQYLSDLDGVSIITPEMDALIAGVSSATVTGDGKTDSSNIPTWNPVTKRFE